MAVGILDLPLWLGGDMLMPPYTLSPPGSSRGQVLLAAALELFG